LEYWNTDFNKPSGVLSTQASLWLHIVYYDGIYTGYECSIEDVRKLVIEQGEVKSNGRNSLCKIIPLEVFKKIAKQSFIIQKDSPGYRKPDIVGKIVNAHDNKSNELPVPVGDGSTQQLTDKVLL
jgi:hypothetical protein